VSYDEDGTDKHDDDKHESETDAACEGDDETRQGRTNSTGSLVCNCIQLEIISKYSQKAKRLGEKVPRRKYSLCR